MLFADAVAHVNHDFRYGHFVTADIRYLNFFQCCNGRSSSCRWGR
ncbi:dihydrolipoamide acetyltransferase component of pyruvate dehydrogenase complex domain protein, partial [Vibrio cholerae CP1050(23)]